jgi:hypothetical protein
MNKLSILDYSPGMEAFVILRIYDGESSTWYDNLNLPEPHKPYITPIRLTRWYNAKHTILEAVVPIFGKNHPKYTIYLYYYDFMAYVFAEKPQDYQAHLLDQQDLIRFPQILTS